MTATEWKESEVFARKVEEKLRYQEIFSDQKSREEVLWDIEGNPAVYSRYLDLSDDFKERFIQFNMGVRGVQMTYDPFFKYIFDAEVHPERLSDMLSLIIGRPLTVKRALPTEHRRISAKGSLLIMDILVEFETGELADVEIQKIGYLFPGQRASCYSSDMVMRQYERVRSGKGDRFSYHNLNKVYTVVLMEESGDEFKKFLEDYVHRGKWVFDTGLEMEMLQEYFFLPLDIFRKIMDNKKKETRISELEAWLYFISSDRMEDIQRVMACHPKFCGMYEEVARLRRHPEEAMAMFSEALYLLDENTVKYMIDEYKQERDQALEEKDRALQKMEEALKEKERLLCEMEELKKHIAENK